MALQTSLRPQRLLSEPDKESFPLEKMLPVLQNGLPWADSGLQAATSRGSVTAQPPPAALKKVHPSCLAVVCLCCPSLPAAGSTVILASAALPLPSCSWPGNWLLPSPRPRKTLVPKPAAAWWGQAPGGGQQGQSAHLLSSVLSAAPGHPPALAHGALASATGVAGMRAAQEGPAPPLGSAGTPLRGPGRVGKCPMG